MKKIAVIGANSYIARNVICNLKNMEVELCGYDLAECQADGLKSYVSLNILEPDELAKIDMSCDIIFMFVGKTGSANGFDIPDTFIDINERALINVLNEYRRQHSSAKIIFPSTRLVYKGKPGPQKESAEKEFKTIYAINKFACENILEAYRNVFGVKYSIFRICLPYGTLIPGATSYGTAEFMISKASRGENISLYGDGSPRRTLTYMGDLVNALINASLCEGCINDVYNIGGEDYSLKEMAELIAAKYKVSIDYVPYPEVALKIESGDTVFDDEKLQGVCPTEYKMTFEEWCREC